MGCRLLLLFLSLCILPTALEGLQCPSCTYVNTSANIPSLIRKAIESILSLFQDDKCSRPINGPTPGIVEETCEPPTGKIARCSFYKGSIDFELYVTKMPLQIYTRGCYYSLPANVPSNGCHNRNQINEDKSFLQQAMAKVSSNLELVSFKGDVCLCSDTYCQTSGSLSVFCSACLVLSMFSLVLVRLMH
ncbi:uncharacterized protein LOC127882382 [Dreissena polymorpha]|uniref:Uncharacterized protein n=1 Tax=Dreissena polymorpha TaxID=45954 RepID=A0A9D4JV35_DREPO|nr:uncharacterized protein LOC127882382 [Dreissena polymorpha]KAH3821377.1 hypothetical protein DPMN_123141 [Dreissena polymorpha]